MKPNNGCRGEVLLAFEVMKERALGDPGRRADIIDGGGVAITTGAKGSLRVPWNSVVTGWSVIADQSGSIAVDILRANDAVPTVSMIGAGNKPSLSAAQFAGDVAPSGWTSTTIVGDDWLTFSVASAATVTRITVDLHLAKT